MSDAHDDSATDGWSSLAEGAVRSTVDWTTPAPAPEPPPTRKQRRVRPAAPDADVAPAAAAPAQPTRSALDDLFPSDTSGPAPASQPVQPAAEVAAVTAGEPARSPSPAALTAEASSTDDDLDDLFDDGDSSAAPEGAAASTGAAPIGGLGDLFDDDSPADEPAARPAVATSGLDDLFPVDADDPAPAALPVDDGLSDLFDADDVDDTPPGPAPAASTPPKAAPARTTPGQVDDTPRRAAAEAAVAAAAAPYAHLDEMWPVVSQILGLFAADPALTRVVQGLKITRDLALDRAQREEFDRTLSGRLYSHDVALPGASQMAVVMQLVYDELLGLSVLGPLWRDEGISEIMVDAFDEISVEHSGVLVDTPLSFRDDHHAMDVARNLAQKISDRQLSPSTPIVSAVLPEARAHFVVAPIVKSGLSMTIRKMMPLLGMSRLLELDALDVEMRDFLADAIGAAANVVISGGTGTGKTTIINACSEFIPVDERIVTIEDVFELRLVGPGGAPRRKWVAMQTKEAASGDDTVRIDTAMELHSSLRMRPDRIFVGEVRDSSAASVLLQATNTGHDGTMCTLHAEDAAAALNFRLTNWVRTGAGAAAMTNEIALAEVAHAFDVIVHVSRDAGFRYISAISAIDASSVSASGITPDPLFVGSLGESGPVFERVGAVRTDTDLARKLSAAGRLERWAGGI